MFAVLIDLSPLLAFIGAIALVLVSLVIGFWPKLESPLIAFLEGVRDWRAERRRRRAYWKTRRHP